MIRNIGQELVFKEDVELNKVPGRKEIIRKGTSVFIGADGFLHYKDGNMQPLSDDTEVKGYSAYGLAEWIWSYISSYTFINENLIEDYDEEPECIKNIIVEALKELGFYDHEGNIN